MKLRLLLVLFSFLCAPVWPQQPSKKSIEQFKAEMEAYAKTPEAIAARQHTDDVTNEVRITAASMSSEAIFNELNRLDIVLGNERGKNPLSGWFKFTDENYRQQTYEEILKNRADLGQIDAAFYHANVKWKVATKFQDSSVAGMGKMAQDQWDEALKYFKIAATSEPSANINIARMYERGFGVTVSKFAAAEFYVKAAEQDIKLTNRLEALSATEAALTAVPDHPAALRLKKQLLK